MTFQPPPDSGHDTSIEGYVVSPKYMTTFTQRTFDPLNMVPSDVVIEDIAHALAMQCRYNGHCVGHLSVARHSIWVAHEVEVEYGHDPTLTLTGLLHDAAECYTGDFIRPIKHRPEMAAFKELERMVEQVIAAAFNLPYPQPEEIKAADVTITAARERDARAHYGSTWQVDEEAFLNEYKRLENMR